jgi:hypothetical protein
MEIDENLSALRASRWQASTRMQVHESYMPNSELLCRCSAPMADTGYVVR